MFLIIFKYFCEFSDEYAFILAYCVGGCYVCSVLALFVLLGMTVLRGRCDTCDVCSARGGGKTKKGTARCLSRSEAASVDAA